MRISRTGLRERIGGTIALWRSFARETRGVAIIEFALVTPILIAMCFGVLVLADVFAVKRKVAITTRTITDLTTQASQISATEMNNLLTASAAIIAPYDQSSLGIVISELDVDGAGVATVGWSRAYNTGTALAKGSVVVLPAGMVSANASVIMGQASFAYVPLTGVKFMGPVTLSDKIYLNPRVSKTITLTN